MYKVIIIRKSGNEFVYGRAKTEAIANKMETQLWKQIAKGSYKGAQMTMVLKA